MDRVRDQTAVHLQYVQQQSQSVMAPCTTGSSLDNTLRVVMVVQEIMTMVDATE